MYNTVQQMHIGFDIELQSINSNAFDFFQKEEKDWLLNMAVRRLMKNKSNKKTNTRKETADETNKRLSDLQSLLTRITLPAYANAENYVHTVLPYNYFEFRNVRATVHYNCNGVETTTQQTTTKVAKVRFPFDSANPKWENLLISLDTGSTLEILFDINDYPNLTESGDFTNDGEKYIIISTVLEIINRRTDIKVRWEEYGSEYFPDQFVFECFTTTAVSIILSFDGIAPITGQLTSINETIYLDPETGAALKRENAKVRIVENEDLFDILDDPYGKTIYTDPVGVIQNGNLLVYHDKKFIVTNISMDYIRKPRINSLPLNQICDLPESMRDEVVSRAARIASAYIGQENYKSLLYEDNLNE